MLIGNMGPFDGVSLKGEALINAVPTFTKQLPLMLGGLAGENIPFGAVVSIKPTDKRRTFYLGRPDSSYIVKGIAIADPSILRADPAMANMYFATRAMTVACFGLIDILEYDPSSLAPLENCFVGFNATTGALYFNTSTSAFDGTNYILLNASVYETLDPNGVKLLLGSSGITLSDNWVSETGSTISTLTSTPAAGAVSSGTLVTLACEDVPTATLYYTTDGTTPNPLDTTGTTKTYSTPLYITEDTTLTVVAYAEGYNPSAVTTFAFTIS